MGQVEYSGSMGSRLNKLAGGVEVPKNERAWTGRLRESFARLDSEYQTEIIKIIDQFRELDPSRAREIAQQISDFFGGVARGLQESEKTLSGFLNKLKDDLDAEKRKKIN